VLLALQALGIGILTAHLTGVAGAASDQIGSSVAGSGSAALRVLFVGNNYTYVNRLPEVIRQRSLAAKERRPMEYRLIAPGGCSLEKHWNDGAVAQALAEGGWDYVVMQEQSTRPIVDPANMHRFACEVRDRPVIA